MFTGATRRDTASSEHPSGAALQARDIMTRYVVSVRPDTPIEEIARRLIERGVSGLPVTEADGKLVGIVSEGDLVRRPELGTERQPAWWLYLLADAEERAGRYVKSHGRTAREVMTTPVWTVDENATLAEIAALLERRRIKRVPVLRRGEVVGIVSRADLLHGLATRPGRERVKVRDRKLHAAITDGLKAATGVRTELLNVTVADGVVHLWGSVPTQKELDAVRVFAENTRGVRRVDNHLRVVLPPTAAR
jgi:CBS domain-containing protein